MLYVNVSKVRQLVCSNRVKVWVEPRGIVDVGSSDMKFLGAAASALITKAEYDKKIAIKMKKKARIAMKLTEINAKSKMLIKDKIKAKILAKAKAKAKILAKAKAKAKILAKAKAKAKILAKAKAKTKTLVKAQVVEPKSPTPNKKIVKKEEPKVQSPVELKNQRTAIKEALNKKNKNDVLYFGRETLGISLKTNDKKDVLINNILNFSKKYGYDKIIKKI